MSRLILYDFELGDQCYKVRLLLGLPHQGCGAFRPLHGEFGAKQASSVDPLLIARLLLCASHQKTRASSMQCP